MAIVLNGDVLHRAAGEPRAAQSRECIASGDEGAEACGQAKELVEGERDELRLPGAETQLRRRQVSRRIEQHVETRALGDADQLEGMTNARKVRLRGISEESRTPCSPQLTEFGVGIRQPQLIIKGKVYDACARPPRIFTNTVERVVIVHAERAGTARGERIALGDELDGG